MGDIRLKRCIQSLESVQSPKPAKNEPLPKLKIRRNHNGFESELSQDRSKKSRDHDVIPSDDVIDLCDDDGVEVVSIKSAPSKKNSSGGILGPPVDPCSSGGLGNPIRRTLRERHRPKRFEDYRTGNTPKSKLFKVSIDLNWPRMTFDAFRSQISKMFYWMKITRFWIFKFQDWKNILA